MQFRIYTDIKEFYNATYDLLMCHEAQNLIPLGNIIIGKEGKDKSEWRDSENWLMATVSDDNDIQLVALMTPPHNITLYVKDNKIVEKTVASLISGIVDVSIPGVTARKDMALPFAHAYCSSKGMSYETSMDQCIYELIEVNPEILHIGTIRLAEESDMYFLPYWLEAMNSTFKNAVEGFDDSTMHIPQELESYLNRIAQKKLFVLEVQGKPVSIAGITREMQTVCGIAPVYTPPYFRRKGYATSCVAKLSQMVLERGFTKCVLYTDLANPTSNSIYQKIGYRPVCDSIMLKFV